MTLIICIKCSSQMRAYKTGARAEEMASFGSYKIWECDVWRCPKCDFMVAAGFAKQPIAEHFQASYQVQLMEVPPTVRF